MSTSPKLSPNNGNKKFHPIYGKFLRVALDVRFEFDSEAILERLEDANLTEAGKKLNLNASEKKILVHEGPPVKISHPAEVEGGLTSGQSLRIKFIPWFDTAGNTGYVLNFNARPLGPNFPIFARFGEDKPFGFNSFKPYITLDYLSLTQEIGFVPVYVKIIDRGVTKYFKISSEELGILEISQVEEREVPDYLVTA